MAQSIWWYIWEILLDRVGGERAERHRRSRHLERPGRQVVHVRDARVEAERESQARPPGGEQELVLRRKARNASGSGENAGVERDLADATDIGRGQRWVEPLRSHVGADEEFSDVGRRHDLVLLSPGEIRPGGAVRRTMPCESRFITVSPFAFGV
jgi:hypothetical protein